ncbi:MAG: UDP-N-acetyl glucosamine 2-epimerase [Candidatus Scalinduaceae bacterium]
MQHAILKILTIIGARPQFIKASAISRAIKNYNNNPGLEILIKEVIVHTGQHYDENMSKIFFDDLEIPRPDYNLEVGSASHAVQTSDMLSRIEQVIYEEYPDIVLLYGDTNSTIAGALAACKVRYDLNSKKNQREFYHQFVKKALRPVIVHVEAGLRSYNRRMPEEVNRIVSDELSDILLCPTEVAVKNLQKEGIKNEKNSILDFSNKKSIHIVANTGDVMYDTALYYLGVAEKKSQNLENLKLRYNANSIVPYVLCTIHRAENTDDISRLNSILEALNYLSDKGIKIILPLHPRTQKIIQQHNIKVAFDISEPFGYLDIILLEKHAMAIATDSGGMQKEAYFFKTPCITLRDETEWVETVKSGWNILAGANTNKIVKYCNAIVDRNKEDKAPPFQVVNNINNDIVNCNDFYGEGNASGRIIDILLNSAGNSLNL